MKLKMTVGAIEATMSVDGVPIMVYTSRGRTVNMNTDQKVKLTEGRWCAWSVDDPMPARLAVYEGAWEQRKQVGWCTRQHASAIAKRDGCGGVWYTVRDGRSVTSTVGLYISGDVDTFLGDEEG